MKRKMWIILEALVLFGPALSILWVLSMRWKQPAAQHPDLHTTPVVISLILGYCGLVVALDIVLQRLRSNRRLSHSILLCPGIAAGWIAGSYALWLLWLTPLRLWFLTAFGLEMAGLFYFLCCCRRRFDLYLFGSAFGMVGLAFFVFAMNEIHLAEDMGAWSQTPGKITHSGGSRPHASKFWTTELAYEYSVDGRTYVGHEDTWASSRTRCGWGENLERVRGGYGWSEMVPVFYDPSRPERAVLVPGLSYATTIVLKMSLLALFGGMTLLTAASMLWQTGGPKFATGGAETERMARPSDALATARWPGQVCLAVLAGCALLATVSIHPITVDPRGTEKIDPVPVTADEFCDRGIDFLRDSDPKRAFNNFTRAVHLEPNDPAGYFNRAFARVGIGEPSQAVDDWKKAIQLDWRMAFRVYYARRQLPSGGAELEPVLARVATDHLRDLEEVSGCAVGYGAEPGDFYTTSLILSAHLAEEDFLAMTRDTNPVVRAMGLIWLARQDGIRYAATIQSFYDDTAEVMYVEEGCVVRPITLAALAKKIMANPDTLQYWDPKKTRRLWSE